MKEKNELIGMGELEGLDLLRHFASGQLVDTPIRIRLFMTLLMQYRCAIREIETKLNVLNEEFSLEHERNPIEMIESRVKKTRRLVENINR